MRPGIREPESMDVEGNADLLLTESFNDHTLHKVDETVVEMYRRLRASVSRQCNPYLIPLFLS